MSAYYEFKLPTKILSGDGALEHIPHELEGLGASRPLLLSDQGLEQVGTVKIVQEALHQGGMDPAETFCRIPPDSSIEVVNQVAALFRGKGCDSLIALGGGSVIDTAKGVGMVLAQAGSDLLDAAGCEVLPRGAHVPFVAIPTTAGTGSETTLAAVVTDTKTHEKYALNDPVLRPKYAVLDPELTVGLPPHITSTTGMDALTHAVEAYIGHSNTKDTSEKAEVATKLIFENLEDAYKNGKDLHAREQMLLASHYAGIAFTRAYVGNVHAIAHNLGGFYGVPHGLANAIILPYVLDFYGETAYERLARLCECAGVAKAGQTDEQKALDFIQAIRDMNARMNIPDKIEKIQEKDIETIAKRACKEANPLYPVPRIMDLDDCIAIIHRLMP